jgi:hypothetical protein
VAGGPERLVELGTFYGESYFGFCQAVKENSISCSCHAVDTWRGDAHGGFYTDEIYCDVEAYNREHYRSFSRLMRMTFADALSSFADDSIDILHIDGYHSYESVREDFLTWIHKVRPGGVVLLHDICNRSANFGVWRLWEEICTEYPHFAFTHSFGLGFLLKPGAARLPELYSELVSADADRQVQIGRYYADHAERIQATFENAQLRTELEHSGKDIEQLGRELEQSRTKLDQSRTELEQSRKEGELLRAGAAATEKEITDLRARLEAESLRREDLERSWSWRATGPARLLLSRFLSKRTL